MSDDFGLTDAGLHLPRTVDELEEIRDEYEGETGHEPDWDENSFLGNITAVQATRLDEAYELLHALYDALDPASATGRMLDVLSDIVGVERRLATSSTVTLELTSSADSTEPIAVSEGERARGGGPDGRAEWRLAEDVEIPPSGGSATAVAEAVEDGPIQASAGAIDDIVTPVDGWASVTNPSAAEPGEARETDPELRRRRRLALQLTGAASPPAIRANLLQLDYLQAAVVLDNPLNSAQTIGGITLPEGAVAPVIYPSSLAEDRRREVIQVIWETVSGGHEIVGQDVQTTVVGADGAEHEVAYTYAAEQVVDVDLTVDIEADAEFADVKPQVESAVTEYVQGLNVGDDARVLGAQLAAAEASGAVIGVSVKFGTYVTGTDYPVALTEVAVPGNVTATEETP